MAGDASGLSRGALFVPFAKAWFIVTAFVTNFALPNLLDAAAVGDFGIVNRIISLVNMVVITGTLQSVSKFVSETPASATSIRRAGLRVHALLSGALLVALLALAGPLASAFNDPRLAGCFRIAAFIPLFYSFYAVHVGTLNGLRRFGQQAGFDIGFATLKTLAVVAAAALGFGVAGVFAAFAAAAATILALALLHGRDLGPAGATTEGVPGSRRVASFVVPLVLSIIVTQALLSADLFVLKAVLPQGESSRVIAGAYFAMLNFAIVPVMLVVAVNAIAFPLISKSTFDADSGQTRATVAQALRLALVLGAGFAVVVAASPASCLRLVYPSKPEYLEWAGSLAVLALAYTALGPLTVMTTLLSGSGRPALALVVSGSTVALQAGAAAVLVPRLGIQGAAAATAFAFVAGCGLAALLVRRQLAAGLPALTLLRVALAFLAGAGVGRLLHFEGLAFIGESILAGLVFVGVLIALREAGRADLEAVLQMARRRG